MASITYIIYLSIGMFATVVVAYSLGRNGKIYLADCFGGDVAPAQSVNYMLLVGFCLINLGVILTLMETEVHICDVGAVIGYLSQRLGIVMLALGLILFLHMFVLHKLRRSQLADLATKARLEQKAHPRDENRGVIHR
jgi:hypothetical protein